MQGFGRKLSPHAKGLVSSTSMPQIAWRTPDLLSAGKRLRSVVTHQKLRIAFLSEET